MTSPHASLVPRVAPPAHPLAPATLSLSPTTLLHLYPLRRSTRRTRSTTVVVVVITVTIILLLMATRRRSTCTATVRHALAVTVTVPVTVTRTMVTRTVGTPTPTIIHTFIRLLVGTQPPWTVPRHPDFGAALEQVVVVVVVVPLEETLTRCPSSPRHSLSSTLVKSVTPVNINRRNTQDGSPHHQRRHHRLPL